MGEYRIKWNKESKIYVHGDVISIFTGLQNLHLGHGLKRITNYKLPPEERELALDQIPEPDFAALINGDD